MAVTTDDGMPQDPGGAGDVELEIGPPLLPVARFIAEGELEIHRGDLIIRQDAAKQILRIFSITNITVLGFLILLFAADVWLVYTGSEPATARIIDRGVVKTLIGATVVQVGTIMLAMSRYLFPRSERQGIFFQRTERPGFFAKLFGRG